jgi:hypothetical protein
MKKVTIGLALLVGLGACQTPYTGNRSQNTYRASEGAFGLETDLGSTVLGQGIEVKNARARREEGTYMVDLDLVSNRGYGTDFEWRVQWFDAADALVKNNSPWRPAALGASATKHLVLVAPTQTSVTWELALRGRKQTH